MRCHSTFGAAAMAMVAAVALMSLLAVSAPAAWAADLTVTSTDDSGPGSLREAIEQADSNAQDDTIDFDLPQGNNTITLTSGQLRITDDYRTEDGVSQPKRHNLTITGPGADKLAVSGDHENRVFWIDFVGSETRGARGEVTIEGLTIRDGQGPGPNSSSRYQIGGAIHNGGNLILEHCRVTDSTSGKYISAGGAIYNGAYAPDVSFGAPGATLLITDSTVSGNSSGYGGGVTDESDERFFMDLSNPTGVPIAVGKESAAGTIRDDDAPALSVNDASVAEGDSGTTEAAFEVSLSAPSAQTLAVDYATSDATAGAGTDYQATSGTLTFRPGQTAETLAVAVGGDTEDEPDESFAVDLSSASNASISDDQGVGTIQEDDDRAPTVEAVSPKQAAKRVSPRISLTATFSEAMAEDTVDATTFALYTKGSSVPVTATSSYDAAARKATLDPARNLRRGATYRAVVSVGAKDLSGNALAEDEVWFLKVRR